MTEEVAATARVVMGYSFWIATAIFLIAYAVIVSEKIHKTSVAVFGALPLIPSPPEADQGRGYLRYLAALPRGSSFISPVLNFFFAHEQQAH